MLIAFLDGLPGKINVALILMLKAASEVIDFQVSLTFVHGF